MYAIRSYYAWAEDSHDRQHDHEPGEGHERIHAALGHHVEDPADVARQHPDDRGQEEAQRHGAQPNGERHPGAIDEPAEEVARERVGAEVESYNFV